jgi:hypothetical protein
MELDTRSILLSSHNKFNVYYRSNFVWIFQIDSVGYINILYALFGTIAYLANRNCIRNN